MTNFPERASAKWVTECKVIPFDTEFQEDGKEFLGSAKLALNWFNRCKRSGRKDPDVQWRVRLVPAAPLPIP
jgi:hypothetical protein